MKNISILFIVGIIALVGCNKDLDIDKTTAAFKYSNPDAKGGSWKAILILKPEDITVTVPVDGASAEYTSQVTSMKAASAAATGAQKDSIAIFGANALVKWNEIARGMAAKYNLPPAANADGTYPVPNAANPGVYPLFPFANPPYASRAFAYWSAAQFDALIVAWYYKYKFNRAPVYIQEPSLSIALPAQDLPGGISEDAVIATVSKEILTFMFPLEASYLDGLANTHKKTRLWANMNTQDEIDAGTSIGKQVADKFIARAKADAMGKANGSPAISDSLGNVALAKFGWKWKSLEVPARPALLPLFGQVKMWCVPSLDVVRPPAPPAPGTDEFKKDLAEMLDLSKNATFEERRIANSWADGPSTSTPPGHWNQIAAELITTNQLNPLRTARIFAYMNMAIQDAGIVCWDAKYFYCTPRPSQVDPQIKTLIGVPNFPGYISGHSTFSAAGATVLSYFFPAEASKVQAYATDASNSRIFGCIHFRHDCKVGLETGEKVGQYTLNFTKVDGADE